MKLAFTRDFLLLLFISSKYVSCLLCYSCSDLNSNEKCFNVTKCPGGEVCYGRADGFLSSEVKHTTGCTTEMSPVKTTVTGAFSFCSNACQKDLCNLGECTKDSNNHTRGPRCLSCNLVKSPDECRSIVECSSNEMCFITRIETFHNTRYRLGCIGKQHCGQKLSSTSIVGKRTVNTDCSVCCSTDHCNLNICHGNGEQYQLVSMSPGVDCPDSDSSLCSAMGRLNPDACKEASIVRTCPKSCATCDHVGWGTWQPWRECVKITNGCNRNSGSRTRSRSCQRRLNITAHQQCVGSSTETETCYIHCPVNGGMCYRSETYDCVGGGGIYCSVRKVPTYCGCPSPAYGGKNC